MLPGRHLYSSLLGYVTIGTCGAISLPQLWLQWRTKKAEGISLTMLILWIIGDIFGLAGVLVQGLLHTQIILGVLNAIIDAACIWQCLHYNNYRQIRRFFRGKAPKGTLPVDNPTMSAAETAIDDPDASPNPRSLPRTATVPSLADAIGRGSGQTYGRTKSFLYHSVFVFIVVGISIMFWGIIVARVRKTSTLKPGEDGTDPVYSKAGAAFGWISMIIYTSSRYPQIYKNWRSKTCQGLSIWIFVLLQIYNTSNIASIVLKSTNHSYIIVNIPWIVNSVYNIMLDTLILSQFYVYRDSYRRADRPPSLGDAEAKG